MRKLQCRNIMRRFRNLAAVAICAVCLLGCDRKPVTKTVEQMVPIERFVAEFRKTHPDPFKNDITADETNLDFMTEVMHEMAEGNILQGVPLRLKEMEKSKGKIFALFSSYPKPYDWEYRYFNDLHVNVVCELTDSLAHALENDSYYCIFGKLSSITEENLVRNVKLMESAGYYVDVSLGRLYYAVDSICKFRGRPTQNITYEYNKATSQWERVKDNPADSLHLNR